MDDHRVPSLAPDVRRDFDDMAHHFYEVRHEHLWRGRGRIALSGVVGATPLRRPDPDAEQINVPADRHNRWKYRLHLTTADLHAAEAFTDRVRDLVATSGRAPA